MNLPLRSHYDLEVTRKSPSSSITIEQANDEGDEKSIITLSAADVENVCDLLRFVAKDLPL